MYHEAIEKYLLGHGFDALRPRAVLFDMDGVLFDSMPNHARSWAQVCTEFGLEMSTEEAYLHEGRTGEATINILPRRHLHRDATPEEVQQLYEAKCRLFNACPEAPKMPGAEELLGRVKAAGLKIVVVTGSGQLSLLERLTTHYPGFFSPDLIVSSKDVRHGKPHPEPYIRAMQLARVTPSQAIAIENAPLGVKSAATSGAFTIGVMTGPVPRAELEGAGAAIVYDSMTECAEAFPTLLYNMLTYVP